MNYLLNHRLATLAIVAASAAGSGCGSEHAPESSSDPSCGGGTSAAAGPGTGASSASGSGGLPSGGASSTDRVWEAAPCPEFQGSIPAAPFGTCAACFGCPIAAEGLSFAQGAFSVDDGAGVTTAKVRTEPGAACMSGTSVGWAVLQLIVGTREKPFDAEALGITQLEFTIDSPPTSGVLGQLTMFSVEGSPHSFDLFRDGRRVSVVSTQTLRVSFDDYQNASVVLDPSRLLAIGFPIGSASAYDFCVRDLKFFDANDEEVLPP
jgi:hypothetical protein